MPLIFFNIGWMEEYKGQSEVDQISGGHGYIREHGIGHEQYNFFSHKGTVYGYAPVKWYPEAEKFQQISIERLGASKKDESIKNVIVVFMAKSPFTQNTYVVGWYKHATVYRWPQESEYQMVKNATLYYVCKTHETDAYCIPASQRTLIIPTAKDRGYGQSTVWYAESRKDIQDMVLRYINNGEAPYPAKRRPSRGAVDQETKKLIETNAVDAAKNFYKKLGFQVDDVSAGNCGWDLTVYNAAEEFYIEVKGTKAGAVNFQLTPNEYAHLQKYWQRYKIATAIHCLGKLKLDIFSIRYDKESGEYFGRNDKGATLLLTEKTEIYAFGSVLHRIH